MVPRPGMVGDVLATISNHLVEAAERRNRASQNESSKERLNRNTSRAVTPQPFAPPSTVTSSLHLPSPLFEPPTPPKSNTSGTSSMMAGPPSASPLSRSPVALMTLDELRKQEPAHARFLVGQMRDLEEYVEDVKTSPSMRRDEDLMSEETKAQLVALRVIKGIQPAVEADEAELLLADLYLDEMSGTLPGAPVTSASEKDDSKPLLVESETKDATLSDQPVYQHTEDNSLGTLRTGFEAICSPSPLTSESELLHDRTQTQPPPRVELPVLPHSLQSETVQHQAMDLSRELLPRAIALRLEQAAIQWDKVQGWTEYLFSDGPNGHVAQREEDIFMQNAFAQLEELKQKNLEDEAIQLATEEQACLPRRLVVTNIAADADEEELEELFKDFKWEICRITILDERDPVKRTQTAYIDMDRREAARFASFIFGFIYGLRVDIRLAVENTGEAKIWRLRDGAKTHYFTEEDFDT
ncbi:hypothetical protein CC80DRAFT_595399 [Byssothecium circinans]|uniref:RRM domain-containing protein n=1 Tax=Byssothecium circinans TaxID=147558 RepID=A0A6A5TQ51_9PLEO|nr:hypothetical protein CC80DRAFT_595399 [Byssothecium circinans]